MVRPGDRRGRDRAGDVSGNGRPDLVVFNVDNPEGENAGWYGVLVT